MNKDIEYMNVALEAARTEAVGNKGLVGAALVHEDEVLSVGANNDVREVSASQAVFKELLQVPHDSTLYITMQPDMENSEVIVKTGVNSIVVGVLDESLSLSETESFFAKHNMDFRLIDDPQLQQECLKCMSTPGTY